MNVCITSELADKRLPIETDIIGQGWIVEILDAVEQESGVGAAVVSEGVKDVWNHNDRKHVECTCAIMDLADRLLPEVDIFGDPGAGVEGGGD